jgi:hypothetical protein
MKVRSKLALRCKVPHERGLFFPCQVNPGGCTNATNDAEQGLYEGHPPSSSDPTKEMSF